MAKVLIPVDGSANSLQAVRHVINRHFSGAGLELHLLHVRSPFSRHIARFLSRRDLDAFHRDEAGRALAPARSELDRRGVPYAWHVELGEKARVITEAARRLGVDQIVIGTARKNSLTRMVEDSVTNKVLELTHVPVEVIAGRSVSRLERIGVPASIGAALALLYMVAD